MAYSQCTKKTKVIELRLKDLLGQTQDKVLGEKMVQLPSRASHEKLLQTYCEPANDVAQHAFQTKTQLVNGKPGSRAVHAHVVNAPAPNPFGGAPLNPVQMVPMQIAAQPAGPSTDAKLKEVIFCADTRPVDY